MASGEVGPETPTQPMRPRRRRRRRARPRPAWLPAPILLVALGVLLWGVAWRIDATQRSVPDGWRTTSGVVLASPEPVGRLPARDLVRWTTSAGVTSEDWIVANASHGDRVSLAYDPSRSGPPKVLSSMRLGVQRVAVGGLLCWMLAAFTAWRYVPPVHRPFRRVGRAAA